MPLYVGEQRGFVSAAYGAIRAMEWLLTSMSAQMPFVTGGCVCGISTRETPKFLVSSSYVVHFSQNLSSDCFIISN